MPSSNFVSYNIASTLTDYEPVTCPLFVCFSLQGMSGVKFKSIFEGKQDIFEEKVMVDSGLLSKLETCGIITNDQRITIEVTYATVLQVLT